MLKTLPPETVRVPLPWVTQRTDYDCGCACVDSIARYAGKRADAARLLKACRAHPTHGTDADDLVMVLKGAGLVAVVESRMESDELIEAIDDGKVVIVSIRAYGTEHWVVVCGYDYKRIIVVDPAFTTPEYGYVPWADFLCNWTATDRRGNLLDRVGIVVNVKSGRRIAVKRVPVP